MSFLADVNFWVALADDAHTHHAAARAWFDAVADRSLVFCRLSQMGFLRVLSSPAVTRGVVTPEAAWLAYETFLSDSRVTFEQEPEGIEARWQSMTTGPSKPLIGAWTDTYLAAFALERGHSFVTFDQGFRRFPALDLTLLEA